VVSSSGVSRRTSKTFDSVAGTKDQQNMARAKGSLGKERPGLSKRTSKVFRSVVTKQPSGGTHQDTIELIDESSSGGGYTQTTKHRHPYSAGYSTNPSPPPSFSGSAQGSAQGSSSASSGNSLSRSTTEAFNSVASKSSGSGAINGRRCKCETPDQDADMLAKHGDEACKGTYYKTHSNGMTRVFDNTTFGQEVIGTDGKLHTDGTGFDASKIETYIARIYPKSSVNTTCGYKLAAPSSMVSGPSTSMYHGGEGCVVLVAPSMGIKDDGGVPNFLEAGHFYSEEMSNA